MPKRMEEMASKGMGKAKEAKARIKGLTGIFKQLAEEHGEVSALLKRVSASSDPDVRADLFPTIRRELLAHERGERAELYPALMNHSETRPIAEEHNREANELEALLDDLNTKPFDSPSWGATFDQLVDTVQHHTREEENDFFPKAQDVIGKDSAEAIRQRYVEKKKKLMQQIV